MDAIASATSSFLTLTPQKSYSEYGFSTNVGCPMKFRRFLPFAALASCSFFISCSGVGNGPCVINCGGGNATLSVTLIATPLTPPPGTNLLSFTVDVTGISLVPSGGTAAQVPITPNASTYRVDLTKLQSDSVFVGTSASVPANTYNAMVVSLSNPRVTFCTQTSGNTGCAPNTLAVVTGSSSTPQITNAPFPLAVTANQQIGIAVNVNLANALTFNAQTQVVSAVNLANANVLSASALPPAASNLTTGELDFIDDVTGNVTGVSGQSVTVKTATRGSLTAVANSSTVFSPNCTNLFNRASSIACAHVGDVASLDLTLNLDGTFTLLEYDPLDTAAGDWIEGTILAPAASAVQFQLVANDFVGATNSLLGTSFTPGTPVTITITGTSPFLIDSKGFNVTGASIGTDGTSLLPGQTVLVHVTSFTAASGTPPVALATIDRLYLRFTRVSAAIVGTGTLTSLNIQSLPSFFGISTQQQVGFTQGAPPSSRGTNFDGVTNGSGLSNQTVSIQALYFRPGTFQYTFVAAKVRAH
jgi:Domain of unknown function (DUF4382)